MRKSTATSEGKICSKCKKFKFYEYFYKCLKNSCGYQSKCKDCHKIIITSRKTETAAYKKCWYSKNRLKVLEQRRSNYQNNKNQIKEKCQQYRQQNKDKINVYFVERSKKNIQFRIASNLRKRLGSAIKGKYKQGSAVTDLGCSIEELALYLECLFLPNMTWDNYGKGKNKWSIDHIKPLNKFDLTIREEILRACHYTNLQPLWNDENTRKGDKYEEKI